MKHVFKTKEEIIKKADEIVGKSLADVLSIQDIKNIQKNLNKYNLNRKGYLGQIIEEFFFNIKPGNVSRPDFLEVGIELKTNPIKINSRGEYVSKERLVFSMIDYNSIVNEKWDSSSFLSKNEFLLIMFYLWEKDLNILDYKFKFNFFLKLLEDISKEDMYQIKQDWEFIKSKIKKGEAHLLSEGDTFYLGACTKAANSLVLRSQPNTSIQAKPRAFSLKQQYLNLLIQTKTSSKLLNNKSLSLVKKSENIEEGTRKVFAAYIKRTDKEILESLKETVNPQAKNYKRLIVNKILGLKDNQKILEFEKANITLKVITLESSGVLKESISFPAFNYNNLIKQEWCNLENENISDLYKQLDTKKFLFIIFKKIKNSKDIILHNVLFWNFPAEDLIEAEKVWIKTKNCIKNGEYDNLPKMKDSYAVHVRPHGKNALDVQETPQKTKEIKRCFWINAKYIQSVIERANLN